MYTFCRVQAAATRTLLRCAFASSTATVASQSRRAIAVAAAVFSAVVVAAALNW